MGKNNDKKHGEKGIVWVFLLFLAVMSLLSVWIPERVYSSSENRYLQKKPDFSVTALLNGSYGEKYETYLSDQFPARDAWIGMKVFTERLAMKKDVNGVYFGKNQYLIEKFDTEIIEQDQLNLNLEKLAYFAGNIVDVLGKDHMRVMLVPSASQIMKDKLPYLASPYDQQKVVEEFQRTLERQLKKESLKMEREDAERLVVPVETYLEQVSDRPLYYKTDHHWTSTGAYYGYRAWAESMGIKPWDTADFKVCRISDDFHGTIYSKLNIPWIYDSIEIYEPMVPQKYRVSFDGKDEESDSLYFLDALETKDQYAVYLDGNHGITEIHNDSLSAEEKEKKLLIIKDSYAHSFAPFAANHYGTVYMADLRYLNVKLGDWIAEKGITDVLVLYQIPGFAKEKTISLLTNE